MLRRKKKLEPESIPNDLYVTKAGKELKPGHSGWYRKFSKYQSSGHSPRWCKVCGYKHSAYGDHVNLRVVLAPPPKKEK